MYLSEYDEAQLFKQYTAEINRVVLKVEPLRRNLESASKGISTFNFVRAVAKTPYVTLFQLELGSPNGIWVHNSCYEIRGSTLTVKYGKYSPATIKKYW